MPRLRVKTMICSEHLVPTDHCALLHERFSDADEDPRARRLARNNAIRQRNKAHYAELERNPQHKPMPLIVMNPQGPKVSK